MFTIRLDAPLSDFNIPGKPYGQPFSSQRSKQKVNMLRHHHCRVQRKSIVIPLQTTLQDRIPSLVRKGIRSKMLAKTYEHCLARFLIMRQHPPILVHSAERYPFALHVWLGYSCPSPDFAFFSVCESVRCEHQPFWESPAFWSDKNVRPTQVLLVVR